MVTPESIQTDIAKGLSCEHLLVQGDGHHFEAVIVSAAFEGKRPIARHQMVYAALGDRMKRRFTRFPCAHSRQRNGPPLPTHKDLQANALR